MPDLDDLALVVAASERGSFGAAARSRHVSQSTVSRAVQRVEAALGRELFSRAGSDATPTEWSRNAIASLRDVVRTWDELRLAGNERAARCSLFCTLTASQSIVPELLASFRAAHPDVTLDLRTGPASDALDAVTSGLVDAAIAPLPKRLPRGVRSTLVATTPLIAIAAPDRASWHETTLILPSTGLTRDLVDAWRRRALPPDTPVHETASHEEVVALAALGSGIGIVPKLVVDTSALAGRLVVVTPPRALPDMRIGLCARTESIERAPVRDLWALVSAEA